MKNQSQKSTEQDFNLGKVPPQATDLENAVLGAIILEPNAINDVYDILKPEVFYKPANQVIYKHISGIYAKGKPIDILTLVNELRASKELDEVGGAYYVSQLTSNIGSASHILDHARIVCEKFMLREIIRISNENTVKCYRDEDVFDVYGQISSQLTNLFEGMITGTYSMMGDVIERTLERIEKINSSSDLIGNHTGFSKLNNMTNGFQPGDYVILAARPSMGKTIKSLIVAKACLEITKKPVLYFSLEMSADRIANRLLSIETGIDSMRIASNRLTSDEWKLLNESSYKYKNLKFFIDDTSPMDIYKIRNKAVTLSRKYQLGMIVIDYIQLITYHLKNKNGNENISEISKTIKNIGKECNCPVLALSQLKRNDDRMPRLSDLRDSGSLEQDADVVWLLYREDYEGRECSEEAKNRIDNAIAKNRNGVIGDFYTYRSDDWTYIGEIPQNELLSLVENMPNF